MSERERVQRCRTRKWAGAIASTAKLLLPAVGFPKRHPHKTAFILSIEFYGLPIDVLYNVNFLTGLERRKFKLGPSSVAAMQQRAPRSRSHTRHDLEKSFSPRARILTFILPRIGMT